MKTRLKTEKVETAKIRTFADFRKRFYPKPVKNNKDSVMPDPDEVSGKLARESIDHLQAVLASL